MIFDTDVLIWIQRGNQGAAKLVDEESERFISIQTYMELLQCAQNKRQLRYTKSFLVDLGFQTLSLSASIGHRAAVYIEEYSLSHGMRTGDAIIAATSVENNLPLCTGNAKHFNFLKNLQLVVFTPSNT